MTDLRAKLAANGRAETLEELFFRLTETKEDKETQETRIQGDREKAG